MEAIQYKPATGTVLYHQYNRPYCHIPTGKKVFISQIYGSTLSYSVHQHGIAGSAITVYHKDLRPWQYGDVEHRVRINSRNEYSFTSFIEAFKFAEFWKADLLTPI